MSLGSNNITGHEDGVVLMKPAHSWREWQIRLLLAGAVPLVILWGLELSFRLVGAGYRPEFWIPVSGRSFLAANDQFAWRFFHRALARTPVPEIVEGKKPPNTRRIFVLGESAAMGFPEPAFGVARMLEAILQRRYPDLNWEVRNAAMTAINSHVVLPIARDCARLEPDAFVVLMGNNEAVGPYGPGTVFGRAGLSLPLTRLSVWQSSTRLGQVTTGLIRDRQQGATEWRGMEMFSDRQLAASDARLHTMYKSFEANLRAITDAGLRSGAKVVLATVPVNLKDCPPFASVHGAGITDNEKARFASVFERAKAAEESRAMVEAIAALREALKIDFEYAEVHFRLARLLLAAGSTSEATKHYDQARDQDALRFRVDSRINALIRNVAKEMERSGVSLADTAAQLGLAGEELFFEHVHLTPQGNYRLATALADKLAFLSARSGKSPSESEVFDALALTKWDESRMREQMAALMDRPPFTAQLDHGKLLTRFRATIEHGPLQVLAEPSYEAAIKARPEDIHLRARYAELLRELGRPADAAAQWTALIDRVPGRKAWYTSRGAVFSEAGRQEEAVADYNRALGLDARYDIAYFGLALARTRQGRYNDAAALYRKAIHINPSYAEAEYNLAGVLSRMGMKAEAEAAVHRALAIRPDFPQAHVALAQILAASGSLDDAIAHYRSALQSAPSLVEAHYDLGVLLSRRGRPDEAIDHYNEAIRLRPNYAEAFNNLGTALARKGDVVAAGRAFARAVAIKPSFEAAHLNLQRLRKLNAHSP